MDPRNRLLFFLVLIAASLWLRPAAAEPLALAAAREHLSAGELEELYLAFGSLRRGEHPEGDEEVAALLVETARVALDKSDAPLALGLAETARRLTDRPVAACLLAAEAALRLEQRGAASEALEAAGRAAPGDGEVLFRRASLAELEGEEERALALFRAVPRRHPRSAEAKAAVARIRVAIGDRERKLAETARLQKDLARKQREAAARPSGEVVRPTDGVIVGAEEETGISGMAARRSQHFRIVYSRGDRDFGQKADFEGKVLAMFEEAYEKVGRVLTFRPDHTFEVVLYTREEWALHFGDMFGGRVLGFYAGKIRMNHADKLNAAFFSTVVHEYTHAAVDVLAGGRAGGVAVWFNEGLATWIEWEVAKNGDRGLERARGLRQARRAGAGIPLAALETNSFATLGGNVTAAYLKSRAAIAVLVGTGGGMSRVTAVIRAAGEGVAFRDAMETQFGPGILDKLDAQAGELLRN